jgi:hypothetical protein
MNTVTVGELKCVISPGASCLRQWFGEEPGKIFGGKKH